jgi:hypothetical protein
MNMKTRTLPLDESAAVNHPAYGVAIIDAAYHFLSVVPYGIDGQSLLSTLTYGSAEDIRSEGIRLWGAVPDARDAAIRIDMLARHMLAMIPRTTTDDEDEAVVPPCCPLSEAIKEAGLTGVEKETIDAVNKIAGIKPGDKVEIVKIGKVDPEETMNILDVLRRLVID